MSAYCSSPKVYHPHNPRAISLYQIVSNNHQEFLNVYSGRFENRYGYLRPEVKDTLSEYLRCGILSYGFARIKCQSCQHEYLLPFSCKERYFCPTCHQRRVLEFSKILTEHILEDVAHRQIVFSIPKMFRIYFLYNRDLLPKLSHCGWESVKEGLEGLAQYIVRCPISEDKIILSSDKHTVIYKSALKPGIKKNFEVYNVLEFLAALTSHIPQTGRKMVIYYGYYSQAARGKRRKDGTHYSKCIISQAEDFNRILRYRWSTLIKKVYADPLICPNCGGRMKIIAFIKKKTVIERILKHLGLLYELPHAHDPPTTEPHGYDITYEPVYDDLTLPEQIELLQTLKRI